MDIPFTNICCFSFEVVQSEEKRYNLKRKNLCKFRENIMRVLTKPYDKKEHQKLLEDITVQKAQLKHIDLRSGRVRFIESDKIGKSYLEYHKGNFIRILG